MPGGRVSHNVANLLLRIEAAIAVKRLAALRIGQLALRAPPAADLRQLRIRLYFDAKAVVVAKVPVQQVQLVHGHEVDEPLDELRALKMPRVIQHEPPPGEAGLIDDLATRDFPLDALLLTFREDLHGQ